MYDLRDPHSIKLTDEQVLHGNGVGEERDDYNAIIGAKPRYGHSGDKVEGRQISALGALGEKAVAVALNKRWDGSLGDFEASDVDGYQVRTTAYPEGCLLLHKADDDNEIFILVTGKEKHFVLQGWTIGRHGKLDKHWREEGVRHPCFFVPQSQLYSMEILPEDPHEFRI